MSVTRGAAGAHHRERFVTRRVEEHDAAAVDVDRVRADVLRDAAGFALGDLRLANRVEQRRLAVVDVAHDGDDRRARRRDLPGFDASVSTSVSSSSKLRISTSAPKSRAIICAVSASSVELIVIIMRRSISFFRTSLTLTSSLSARSLTRHAFGERDELGDRRRRLLRHRHRTADRRGARDAPRARAGRPERRAGAGRAVRRPRRAGRRTDESAATAADAGRRAAARGRRHRRARRPAGRRAGGAAPGRVGAGGACCGRMTGRGGTGRAAGASPVSGSSMRSRRVGGTRRPGRTRATDGRRRRRVRRGGGARRRAPRRFRRGGGSTARRGSRLGARGSSTGVRLRGRLAARRPTGRRGLRLGAAPASATARLGAASRVSGVSSASAAGLIVLIRRGRSTGAGGLRRLGRLAGLAAGFLAGRRVGEQRAVRQRDVAASARAARRTAARRSPRSSSTRSSRRCRSPA